MDENVELFDTSFDFDSSDSDILGLDVKDLRDQPGITYPAVLLTGIQFVDSLRVLQASKKPSYRDVDVWVELAGEGEFQHIGTIQLTSDILLLLRYLRIGLTIYYSADRLENVDLRDASVIERFI